MLILAIHQTPSLTQEKYEEVVRYVFDIFESEEAVERFRHALGTIPEEVGIEEPPQFFPAHTAMSVLIERS
jgi:hypothetical protein